MRAELAGASYRSERCVESEQHLDCAVTLRRDGADVVVHFRIAPNADFSWSIESYELA